MGIDVLTGTLADTRPTMMDVEVDDAVDDTEDDVVVAIKIFTFKITILII